MDFCILLIMFFEKSVAKECGETMKARQQEAAEQASSTQKADLPATGKSA
jgi:hypothetical protein